MGPVRENLPTGNPNNKAEYLADAIDSASSEIESVLTIKLEGTIGDSINKALTDVEGVVKTTLESAGVNVNGPQHAIQLDGRVGDQVASENLGQGPLIKRVVFDFYSEERFLPFIHNLDPSTGEPKNDTMYLAGYHLHINEKGTVPTTKNDYIHRLLPSTGELYVDGDLVPSHSPVGWMFDGRPHTVEIVYSAASPLDNLGGSAFTGCIWNVRGYNELDELALSLPLNGGHGERFIDEVNNVAYYLKRNANSTSKWVTVRS